MWTIADVGAAKVANVPHGIDRTRALERLHDLSEASGDVLRLLDDLVRFVATHEGHSEAA